MTQELCNQYKKRNIARGDGSSSFGQKPFGRQLKPQLGNKSFMILCKSTKYLSAKRFSMKCSGYLMVNRLVGVGAHGSRQRPHWPLQTVGPTDDGGHRSAVESLGQGVASSIALKLKKS
jgi:hypothetical protein